MVEDQGDQGTSTAFSHSNVVITYGGVRIYCSSRTVAMRIISQAIIESEKQEEHLYEPYIPTRWKLECRRYDRINANRSYLQQVAKAKRHLNLRRFRKLARKKIRR